MESNCLFCSIAKKEISAEVVYEDEQTIAFLDIHPQAVGHTILIPKSHAETTLDLGEGEYEPLFRGLVETEKKIQSSLNPEGFTIGINQKKAAGQEIDHLHIHIIPRFFDDGGGSIQRVVSNFPKESLEEVAKKING